jgi:hypothetical protein
LVEKTCISDFESAGDYLFAGKILHGPFQGIFLGFKKVEALSKYPEKWPTK